MRVYFAGNSKKFVPRAGSRRKAKENKGKNARDHLAVFVFFGVCVKEGKTKFPTKKKNGFFTNKNKKNALFSFFFGAFGFLSVLFCW